MLFAGAKTPLQRFRWLKKRTSTVAFCPLKDTLQRPCQFVAIVPRGVRFCRFGGTASLFNNS